MSKRKIIKIGEDKCNGCGLCIPNCPEGAIQLIDGKARLISDLFCDGLGACLGHCPEGAITIEEREAAEYKEKEVMKNIVKGGPNVIKAHLEHLHDHGQKEYLAQALEFLKEKKLPVPSGEMAHAHGHEGCPGSKVLNLKSVGKMEQSPSETVPIFPKQADVGIARESQLSNWPVQIKLVPANAPYFKGADILVAADCVPFAYPEFHEKLLKGKVLLVGCPKLDDIEFYKEKIAEIVKNNDIKSVTYVHMEVPCCFGLVTAIQEAIEDSGKKAPFKESVISIRGEFLK